ncbi:hypothetical protein HN011_008069 [Eciton burchellii]|nr:hypothetical protein HN011_008069 [Eciton burchellii]
MIEEHDERDERETICDPLNSLSEGCRLPVKMHGTEDWLLPDCGFKIKLIRRLRDTMLLSHGGDSRDRKHEEIYENSWIRAIQAFTSNDNYASMALKCFCFYQRRRISNES